MTLSLPATFWRYFAGQSVSNVGSAFTAVAVPLLVYRITHSATELGAATAVAYLPWALFGLLGGAVVDRVDRKRAMILCDVVRAATICVIPTVSAYGDRRLTLIYAVVFVQACMQVIFASCQFAAVASLVTGDRLPRANAVVTGSFSGATLAGAALAGLLFSVTPIADALYVDGFSFFVSAVSLFSVRTSFNETPPRGLRGSAATGIARALAHDVKDGVTYVWRHRVLRSLSLQLLVVNLFGSAATAELVLFATQRLGADNAEIGYLNGASGLGVVMLSFVVGVLNRRLPHAVLIGIALGVYGAGTAVLGLLHTYLAALLVECGIGGATVLYNVTSATLRQRIVPDALMGRAWSISLTGAWCVVPIGSLGGGLAIGITHDVRAVYVTAGAAIFLIALAFNPSIRRVPEEAAGNGRSG